VLQAIKMKQSYVYFQIMYIQSDSFRFMVIVMGVTAGGSDKNRNELPDRYPRTPPTNEVAPTVAVLQEFGIPNSGGATTMVLAWTWLPYDSVDVVVPRLAVGLRLPEPLVEHMGIVLVPRLPSRLGKSTCGWLAMSFVSTKIVYHWMMAMKLM
jgi:hypothetical protein